MKPFRTTWLAAAAFAFGCAGPYEVANPRPDPDDATARPRVPARDEARDCVREGVKIPPAADAGPPSVCCAGLTRAEAHKGSILRLDECELDPDGPAFCISCGDGRCGVGENTCNCRADCSWP
jgi:hypothetical protein